MANDKAEFWTTEQVAAHLGITVKEIYESARANRFPGNLGTQRGRRKLYRSDLILAGPQEPKTTSDPVEAILWTLAGIEKKLVGIAGSLAEIAAKDPTIIVNVPPPPRPRPDDWQDPIPDPEPSLPEAIQE